MSSGSRTNWEEKEAPDLAKKEDREWGTDSSQEMETSAEAWAVLAGQLDHGPLAVVWHEGNGPSRSDFDTVLELRGEAILQRTYQQGKVVSEGGHTKPGRLCWTDTWTRERAAVIWWPYLDNVLDMAHQQQKSQDERGSAVAHA